MINSDPFVVSISNGIKIKVYRKKRLKKRFSNVMWRLTKTGFSNRIQGPSFHKIGHFNGISQFIHFRKQIQRQLTKHTNRHGSMEGRICNFALLFPLLAIRRKNIGSSNESVQQRIRKFLFPSDFWEKI